MTILQILEAINSVRLLTSPPRYGENKVRDVTTINEADNQLLDLQERLIRGYGDDHQSEANYLKESIKGFYDDPPSNEFEHGIMDAYLTMYEDLFMTQEERRRHRQQERRPRRRE